METQQLALQQLEHIDRNIRVIVIHPNFDSQHLVLSQFLYDSVYVRLHGSNLSGEQTQAQIEAAVHTQEHSTPYQLVLDECDRVADADLNAVLHRSLEAHPQRRIVLLSRVAPPTVLSSESLRSVTCFIPAQEELMLWDYAQHETRDEALLEVRALGPGRVHLNGRLIEDWDGTLPRNLFFFLVDRGLATRNDIFATFWPHMTIREATNVFHVTKRKISEILGVDLTVYWSGFYRISPDIRVSYDVAHFTQLTQESAVAEPAEAMRLAARAMHFYRGDFLDSIETPWVQQRRQDLVNTYFDALVGLARAAEQMDKLETALASYIEAATLERQREDLTLSTMRLFQALKMPADALKAYRRLHTELQTTLGVQPSRALQALAAQIEAELQAAT